MKKIFACILVVLGLFTICACNKVPTKTTSFDNGSVKMIAHRGLSGMEVENTESAFIEAGKRSYYGIESDVRKTRDGKFVMCHDATLTRIAGKNIEVETSTLEDLLKVPLLPKREDDVKVEYLTTLERYIIICKEYDKQAILELKSIFTEAEIKNIIDIIDSLGYISRTTFISFDYDNLLYVRKILPEQSAMYLFSAFSTKTIEQLVRDNIDVALSHQALTPNAVNAFHKAGLKVNCWTVDGISRAENLVEMGVDYITTNVLE